MDNYEFLCSVAENCHPKFIANVNGQRVVVGEVVDGVVYLTDAGRVLQEQTGVKRGKRVSNKVVQSDNVSKDEFGTPSE